MSAGGKLPGTPEPMHWWAGTGGLRIAGDTCGDPTARLVVLLHGADRPGMPGRTLPCDWPQQAIALLRSTPAGTVIRTGRRTAPMAIG